MKTVHLVESLAAEVCLDDDQVRALQDLARRLARGPSAQQASDDASDGAGAPLSLRPVGSRRWQVRVNEAVGVIAVPGLTLISVPKIPQSHLFYLLECAGYAPREDRSVALLAESDELWRVVCRWFLAEAEALLRRGLARDYRPAYDTLPVLRGRVDVTATVMRAYRGRPSMACTFDEFDEDSPLNRVVRAAALAIGYAPVLPRMDRRRAQAIVQALHGVGQLRADDTGAVVSRSTRDYADVVALAKMVLTATGPGLESGSRRAWSFLIRTPEAVEAGIRCILDEASGTAWDSVQKATTQLHPSSLTMTPDLLFAPLGVVGDVKYRLGDGSWQRSDVYQAAAFATAFRAPHALVVGFRVKEVLPPSPAGVGDVTLSSVYWDARPGTRPKAAAAALVGDVTKLLSSAAPVVAPSSSWPAGVA